MVNINYIVISNKENAISFRRVFLDILTKGIFAILLQQVTILAVWIPRNNSEHACLHITVSRRTNEIVHFITSVPFFYIIS